MSKEQNMNTSQGHWILAKMGKRVLRPGGKELSMKMIEGLNISPNDDVVEFAPGLGFTAGITLGKNPKSYTGVELNEEGGARILSGIENAPVEEGYSQCRGSQCGNSNEAPNNGCRNRVSAAKEHRHGTGEDDKCERTENGGNTGGTHTV